MEIENSYSDILELLAKYAPRSKYYKLPKAKIPQLSRRNAVVFKNIAPVQSNLDSNIVIDYTNPPFGLVLSNSDYDSPYGYPSDFKIKMNGNIINNNIVNNNPQNGSISYQDDIEYEPLDGHPSMQLKKDSIPVIIKPATNQYFDSNDEFCEIMNQINEVYKNGGGGLMELIKHSQDIDQNSNQNSIDSNQNSIESNQNPIDSSNSIESSDSIDPINSNNSNQNSNNFIESLNAFKLNFDPNEFIINQSLFKINTIQNNISKLETTNQDDDKNSIFL